ncbi:MAG: RluA family pseudouridine synthase [Chitinophagales bacterium]|nr:RluA family pseudouridine synthase [Chitinophagales bacterium]MCB9020756.1 RluA family pseudouridine synthase [Chitinophagales bacterium]HAE13829.1 RluA family pseudouridine synthase [Bacteroidota bacterium]HQU39596.1 RluA family pseudouridine synthase [Chitinophagales bacterium]
MLKLHRHVIYSDDDIILVNKPAGIPVIPERGKHPVPSLQEQLSAIHGKLWIVHRIDRDTSGLVVIAKTAEAHAHLSQQFEMHSIRKEYLALVYGVPAESPAQIDVPLKPHPTKNIMLVDGSGKPSTTLIKTEEAFRRHTLLRVRILTGRRHQIRVHLAYIGNPLLVDTVYGSADAFYLSAVKKGYKSVGEERPLISRLTLHATLLEFIHPASEEPVLIESPLPADMEVVCKQLRRWDS